MGYPTSTFEIWICLKVQNFVDLSYFGSVLAGAGRRRRLLQVHPTSPLYDIPALMRKPSGPADGHYMKVVEKNGTPGEIRTPDPLLRRQVLYPAELRAQTDAKDFHL